MRERPTAKYPASMRTSAGSASQLRRETPLARKPATETFVFHDMDHPLWLGGARADIPQPGGYSHFHWTGLPEHAEELAHDQAYPGYFLELSAVRRFAFEHAGEQIPVGPGLDLATHVNITASFPMGCSGHGGGHP